jgi:hypothetical protein
MQCYGDLGTSSELTLREIAKEHSVGNSKNPNEKQPGEKEPGTFHYNPGNMSGKTIGTDKNEPKQSDDERAHSSDDDRPDSANEKRK